MGNIVRRLAAAAIGTFIVCSAGATPRAQSVPALDKKIQYLMPQWLGFLSASQNDVNTQAAVLRSRIGEGVRVKVGFTVYILVNLSPVDPADTAAVRASLAPAIADLDNAIGRARGANIPIAISFVTAIREWLDAAQSAAQAADRRSMQWYMDNSLADGWVSLSRYNRKQRALEEAALKVLGAEVAARMLQYPDTLVAVSGDGEVELSYYKSLIANSTAYPTEAASLLTDYSPFAIKEFADWVRQGGMYAPGQPFAGEAYALSSRYAGDLSPDADSNGDGHTFNGDFGTTAFKTWNLKQFDWSLADATTPIDPGAMPASASFDPAAVTNSDGFDAPRVRNTANEFWKLWDLFRQTMVHRYNIAFAKAMTTGVDAATGATIPAERFYTDQIPSDYLFTNSTYPGNDAGSSEPATFRHATAASPHWTADVSPYGSLGITSFNVNAGNVPPFGNVHHRTLAAVAPHIAARGVRWGIFEWNPSVPESTDIRIYDLEMALVEKYRPSLLAPFDWEGVSNGRILDTPFETALKNWVTRRNNIPLTLSRSKVYAATSTDGATRSAPQIVRVSGEPGETPTWNATSAAGFVSIVKSSDGRSFTVELTQQAYAAGVQSATVTVQPTSAGYTPATLTVEVTATAPAATQPPVGFVDTPADLQIVTGEVGMTGWAVDDVGIRSVDIYRSPLAGEPTHANGLVFLGTATPVEGARPDVEAVNPTAPASSQAGWGYMLLSNFLPNSGTGVFTLHALATDLDGHTVSLGTRRIDARNSTGVLPFGTIDTPLQGQTVSGTIVNFGWALTPSPSNFIPTDGSTIDVYIDNVRVGSPVYNNFRADIAGLFPGLANTNGAIGYFYIDTTTLTNGRHSIAWVVRDNTGAATGIGSRYFNVVNP